MTLEEIRSQFPITSTEKIYLNHAAKSPFHLKMTEEMKAFTTKRLYDSIEYFPELVEDKLRLKSLLGHYLNAEPQHISLVQNTVEGLNLLVDHLEWEKGDEVILFEKDFPSNVYPFLKLKSRGVKIRVVPAKNYLFTTADYLNLLTPHTKILTVSFVHFLTGQVADLKALGDACKQNNTLFCVDTIQGLGALQLDVQDLHIDFLSNGGHKWMMFPSGCGYLYFSEKLKQQFVSNREGWITRKDAFDLFNWDQGTHTDGRRFELGSGSDLLVACAKASMEWRCEIGHTFIEQQILDLSSYLRAELQHFPIDVLGDDSSLFGSGIVSFQSNDVEKIYNTCIENGITLAIRNGVLRVSPHFYNTKEEIDKALEVIKRVVSS